MTPRLSAWLGLLRCLFRRSFAKHVVSRGLGFWLLVYSLRPFARLSPLALGPLPRARAFLASRGARGPFGTLTGFLGRSFLQR